MEKSTFLKLAAATSNVVKDGQSKNGKSLTGKEKWITQPFGKYWSLIASGDVIVALDERGELLLIRASEKEFKLISRRKDSEKPTWAHIGLLGEQLLIRDLGGLTVWSWKELPE